MRQRGSGVESLCDVQRVRNDVGTSDARVAKLGLQSARPQTSPGGAKPNATLIREELELDGQKANHTVSARLAHMAPDRPDIALACGGVQPHRPHTSETCRTISAARVESCMAVPVPSRKEHRDE